MLLLCLTYMLIIHYHDKNIAMGVFLAFYPLHVLNFHISTSNNVARIKGGAQSGYLNLLL